MGGRVSFSDRVSTAQSENFIKVKIIEWKLKFILCRVLQNNGTVRACCERIFEPRSVYLTINCRFEERAASSLSTFANFFLTSFRPKCNLLFLRFVCVVYINLAPQPECPSPHGLPNFLINFS